MYIAKFNELIIDTDNIQEDLINRLQSQCKVYTSIEETAIEYKFYRGKFLTPKEIFPYKKQNKIKDNDTARDEALNKGVTYKDVLFDSDTDQKVNLLATVSMMGDEDTITWFGKDNQPLVCTKQDLLNIGGLITQLHSFCWNKNAEIKQEISEAMTIQELDNIEIDYELPSGEQAS